MQTSLGEGIGDTMGRHVYSDFSGTGCASRLVVALHGCTWSTRARHTQLRHVIDATRETFADADILAPILPIEFWSLRDASQIVREALAEIDRACMRRHTRDGGTYREVVLVGFSFGSVLVRSLFCVASGMRDDATLDPSCARPWVGRVNRIVLIAGLNRGWTVDSPVSRLTSLWNNIGTAIGHLLPRKPTLFAIRRGAAFLTLTRLQWLALKDGSRPVPLVVQLLGTRDDIVSPNDNVDLATGGDFLYVEVPQTGHFDVVDMSPRSATGVARRVIYQTALAGSRVELSKLAVKGGDLPQMLPAGAETSANLTPGSGNRQLQDVVFVVHGIRDKGYWTRKIGRVVTAKGNELSRQVVAVTPSYGYFPILPFLCPWTRRAKVEWLLDEYVAIRAWHPEAAVSFIGHSNGTYILSGALESCRAVRFKNVVFAGSVVRCGFDWISHFEAGQVRRVLNYVATADWVVAIFPRLFQVLGLQDLGSAGHDGFSDGPPVVIDVEYVPGHHSAALDEQHWDDIAAFVLDGKPPTRRPTARQRDPLTVAAAIASPVIWMALIATAATPAYIGLTALGFPELIGVGLLESLTTGAKRVAPAWILALGLMAYLRVLLGALTRL